ncbi:transmembrane water channel [Fischerella sp. NIES-4106]|jgi:aquaporin Z|nr:transmembrane water channel [Fischerella sp. NIES-4106]
MVSLFTRCLAEFVGTFVLVIGGCGSSVFAVAFPNAKINELGIGFLGEAEPEFSRRDVEKGGYSRR